MKRRDQLRVPSARPGTLSRLIGFGRSESKRAAAWAAHARDHRSSVDVGFRLADRDRKVAAGVLAGGVAYRLFLWLIAGSVVTTGVLGFADGDRAEEALRGLGMDPLVADVVTDLSQQSQEARGWLLLVGTWLVLWAGYLGAKAFVLVHATVWDVPPPPVRRPLWVSLTFSGLVLAFVASMSLVRWLRTENAMLGLMAWLASLAVPVALWLVVSLRLPHRGAGWRALLPGACLVAIGVEGFYLFTTYFLAPKLANATDLYGAIGFVSTILFWFYLVGRLAIGAATLSASVHEHRVARARETNR